MELYGNVKVLLLITVVADDSAINTLHTMWLSSNITPHVFSQSKLVVSFFYSASTCIYVYPCIKILILFFQQNL